jgi:hypothetical protein
MAKARKPDLDEATRQIAQRMLSMPPKRHDEMKIGKAKKPKPRKKHLSKPTRVVRHDARSAHRARSPA